MMILKTDGTFARFQPWHKLASECVLEQANTDHPADVLANYFGLTYDLGVQAGIRQTADSLDAVACEDKSWSEIREKA